ncbi:MAG: hypothetical protein N2260_00620 [Syntrophobacterales bacterium]|nr:hypothetical protein [Syntrophobacterales bacterium]
MWHQFFKNKKEKNVKRAQIRIKSCIETILDLNERLGEGKIKPEIVEKFRKLLNSFAFLEDDMVDERELNNIEEATNQLLEEIGRLYGEVTMKQLYDIPKH